MFRKRGYRNNRSSLVAATLAAATLLLGACGGGSDGPAGPAGPAGSAAVATTALASNAAPATAASAAAWEALAPQIEVTGVTIASPPVVKFTVKDANGNGITGLNNKSQSATATVAGLTNIGFTLAKLVPGTNGAPSKWVSYNVLRPPTVAEKAGTIAATTSCNSATAPTWCGTYPTTDTQGTLVDNGGGSYTYTFYRDPKAVATLAAGLIDTANGLNKKADLGDLTFDATATHRLGIQLGGAAPGTGSNTPNAVTVTTAVNMVNTANIVYDFRPDGGSIAKTRNIVKIDSCSGCHDGKVLAHGSRKNPEYCVTCHTEQIKYSFSMEAPATGLQLTGGTTGTTAQKRAETAVVDGRAIGNFPNFMHKLHMGSRLIKQGYNYNAHGGAMLFNNVKYPQNVLSCTKCHDGSTDAVNKTADGDNWKSVPSRLACGSCHDGINFATGQGTTISKATTGHVGSAQADDSLCALCHNAASMTVNHSDKLPTTADAAKRTMSAAISKVTIGATDGSVTVTFTVKDGDVAVTDMTKFTKPAFGLAKLVPAANGESSHWVSYTSRFRTKSATMAPVLQGNKESDGTLTANADGSFNYKFKLSTATVEGDIRTVSHAHNVSTIAPYATTNWTGAGATVAGTGVNVVSYEPTLTHRVAMLFQKEAGTTDIDNVANAYFDFVPAGGAVTSTRNIVTMENCKTCHAGVKLHEGYTTEYCVMCHNQSTFDPFTGETVDFQRLIHKLHMGSDLETAYVVNGTHDYSKGAFPGNIGNCANACHKTTATKVGSTTLLENRNNWETMPTSRACGTCHDSSMATTHINSQISGGVEMCEVCHGTNAIANVKAVHSK